MVPEKTKSVTFTTISIVVYDKDKAVKKKVYQLPEKQFSHRESLLTVLFEENPHVKTVHHIAVALVVLLILTEITRDFLDKHEIPLGFRIIYNAFGKLPIALAGWILYFSLTCTTYFCFKMWTKVRTVGPSKKFWDVTASLVLLGYYIFTFRLAAYLVNIFELPQASAAIILMEQPRMLMKVHAFIRSNVSKVFMSDKKFNEELELPTFGHFVYFTMAPTLVYKDEYPRTSTIRWKRVATYVFEVLGIILFYAFGIERLMVPLYKDFGLRKFTYTELFSDILQASLSGMLTLTTSFYLTLHVVQNFFAEILRFGDRKFYKDWWTAPDWGAYHNSWNLLVRDWFYTYVFKDCYEVLIPGNKMVAKFLCFLISALVHEWIMMNMLGFLFPLMFALFFVFGAPLSFFRMPNKSFYNILFWLGLSFGGGVITSGYTLEFYARYNDVSPLVPHLDFYIPRCITCDCYK